MEDNLSSFETGKIVLGATFITDITMIIMLSILLLKPNPHFIIFLIISTILIILATKYSNRIINHSLKDNAIEPEIKYIFALLFIFMYFAYTTPDQAVLPAFILGIVISNNFPGKALTIRVRNKVRTVTYAIIAPLFFIVGGLRVSFYQIFSAFGLFIILFIIKVLTKFLGVYFSAKKYTPEDKIYTPLIMNSGLTLGTIASIFGLNSGLINQVEYFVLIGVVVSSAIIPTFIAQKWFKPKTLTDKY